MTNTVDFDVDADARTRCPGCDQFTAFPDLSGEPVWCAACDHDRCPSQEQNDPGNLVLRAADAFNKKQVTK